MVFLLVSLGAPVEVERQRESNEIECGIGRENAIGIENGPGLAAV